MHDVRGMSSTLFKGHGILDTEKCIGSLFSKTDGTTIDIEKINKEAMSGLLYVKSNGTILPGASLEDDEQAKYKIIPTGLFLKGTNCPIFASFLRFNNKPDWEGVYIGTAEQLFKMYKQHYINPASFDNEYVNIFCGDNSSTNIIGFGLNEVLKNRDIEKSYLISDSSEELEEQIDDKEDSTIESLTKAITKLNEEASKCDNSTKGKRDAKKILQKAELLQSRLDKIIAKQKKQGSAEHKKEDVFNITEEEITETEIKTKEMKLEIENIAEEEKTEQKQTEEADKKETLINSLRPIDSSYEQSFRVLTTEFLNNLYNRLLYKENWMIKGKYRLDFYIRNIIKLLEYERQKDGNQLQGNGYVYSVDKTRCILNLGLIDTYGNDIYILDNTPTIGDFRRKDLSIVDSKVELLGIGFKSENIKNLPDTFDMRSIQRETIFDANEDDFDFMDTARLNHLIEERRSRFPKKYANESPKLLCDRLKESIVRAIKMSKTDYRYIVPKYDFFRNQVQFLIPFHLDNDLSDTPELAIVVGKNKDLWCVYTILSMEDALADSRLLFRPTNWLRG